MTDDLLEYQELFRVLNDHGVRFVIVGGLAVNAHGVIRATADADVVPEPARDNLTALSRALAALEAHVPGADPAGPDPRAAATLAAGATVKYETRLGPLHVVQGQPGQPDWDELWRDAMELDVDDVNLRVCSYEHLIEMKQAAGRAQDQIDVTDLRDARAG